MSTHPRRDLSIGPRERKKNGAVVPGSQNSDLRGVRRDGRPRAMAT